MPSVRASSSANVTAWAYPSAKVLSVACGNSMARQSRARPANGCRYGSAPASTAFCSAASWSITSPRSSRVSGATALTRAPTAVIGCGFQSRKPRSSGASSSAGGASLPARGGQVPAGQRDRPGDKHLVLVQPPVRAVGVDEVRQVALALPLELVVPSEPRRVQRMTGRLHLHIAADEPVDADAVIRPDPPLGIPHLIMEYRVHPDPLPRRAQQPLKRRADRRLPVTRAGKLQAAFLAEYADRDPQPFRRLGPAHCHPRRRTSSRTFQQEAESNLMPH